MSDKIEACRIAPRANFVDGTDDVSPLYQELLDVCNGDRNRAVPIYLKATSDEVLDAVNQLPNGLAHYYPNSTTPTLATVLNVAEFEGEGDAELISENELRQHLQNQLSTSTVDKLRNMSIIADFNSGEWNTRFEASCNAFGDIIVTKPVDGLPDPSPEEYAFAYDVYQNLVPIFRSLGFSEDQIDSLTTDPNMSPKRHPKLWPADLADLLANVARYADGTKSVTLQCFDKPNVAIAKVIMVSMRNHAWYSRLLNYIRDNRLHDSFTPSESSEAWFNSLDENGKIEAVALFTIAQVVNRGNTTRINPTLKKLIDNLLAQFKQRVKNNAVLRETSIKEVIKKANENHSIVDSYFVAKHPIFINENMTGTDVSQMQTALDKITKLTIQYLAISNKLTGENASNTENFTEENQTWYDNINAMGQNIGETQRDKLMGILRMLVLDADSSTRALQGLLQSLSFDKQTNVGILSNNTLCGKLRQATNLISFLSKLLDELERVHNFQKENKIADPLFTQDLGSMVASISAALNGAKKTVLDIEKTAVINELEKYCPHTLITLPTGDRVSIKEWVNSDISKLDITGMERWVTSMEECSNPILNMFNTYKKYLTEQAKQETIRLNDELKQAAAKLPASERKHQKWMFSYMQSIDANGNITGEEVPTGRYIMDYDYGLFMAHFTKFNKSLAKRHLSREMFREAQAQEWERVTEERPEFGGLRLPRRDMFPNAEFNALTAEQKNFWEVFMRNKAQIIKMFPERHYGLSDAIYIRKDNRDTILQAKGPIEKMKALIKVLFVYPFKYTSRAAQEFGSDELSQENFEKETLYNLPSYYTSLYEGETMDDISTDCVSGLTSYAEVMFNTACLKQGINVLECGVDVIRNQNYKARPIVPFRDRPKKVIFKVGKYKTSGDYTLPPEEITSVKMYKEWLKTQIYGHYSQKVNPWLIFTSNAYMRLVSFGTLALNTTTAVANIIQGLSQIVPMAIGGYHFNVKDLTKATLLYDDYMFNPFKNGHGLTAISDIGALQKNNKLTLFSRKFNIMQEFSESGVTKDYNKTRAERLFNGNILYAFLHMGEHFLQHKAALAMLYNEKNLLRTASGESITAFEAYDSVPMKEGGHTLVLKTGLTVTMHNEDYKIVTNEELRARAQAAGKNINDSSLLKEGEVSESNWISYLSQKMGAMNHYLHGIYNKEDRTHAEYYALGRMAIMYRKYLFPALNSRFGVLSYNAALDVETEGYYRSLWKLMSGLTREMIGNYHKDYEALNPDMQSIVYDYIRDNEPRVNIDNPEAIAAQWASYDKRTRQNILFGARDQFGALTEDKVGSLDIVRSRLTDVQKANVRTALAEVSIFFSLLIGNILLDGDDDDDDTLAMAATKYYLRREQTELGALTPASILLTPFLAVSTSANPELHAVGRASMGFEMAQLLNQPVIGVDRFADIPELFNLLDPAVWEDNSAKYDKKRFNTEAERILNKQLTPWRQYKSWTVESFQRKEKFYKQ